MKKHYYDEERKNERVKKGNKNWNSLYEKSNSVYVVMNRRSSTMIVQQQRNLIPFPVRPRPRPPSFIWSTTIGTLPIVIFKEPKVHKKEYTYKKDWSLSLPRSLPPDVPFVGDRPPFTFEPLPLWYQFSS